MSDNVNKPAHYNQGGIETIDSIRASTGDGFIWYCVGNADKYIGRCRYKGKLLEDLRKCRNYVDWAIAEAEKLEAAGESGNCPVMPDSSDRKPIAIPAGWRELEPDEVPVATDMHEWMGGWFYRSTDATHEYKWHDIRHIRKIETANPSVTPNSSIPNPGEGYRLLSKEPSEPVREGDEFWRTFDCKWIESKNWKHEGGPQAPSYYYRRKIETKPTEWVPSVGDKVRVVGLGLYGEIEYANGIGDHCWLVLCQDGSFRWLSIKGMELIEAAS